MSGPDPRVRPRPPLCGAPPRRAALPVRLWRWRTEILLLAGLVALAVLLLGELRRGVWWPPALIAGALLGLTTTRPGRDWIVMRFWCVFSRHRLRRLFAELPLHTRTGRLPLVLWITPTAEGEKALVMCRAGVSADAFAAFAPEFEAACSAMRVRFAKHLRHPQLVMIEIVRRPPRPQAVPPGLERLFGYGWVPLAPRPAAPVPPGTAGSAPEAAVPLPPRRRPCGCG